MACINNEKNEFSFNCITVWYNNLLSQDQIWYLCITKSNFTQACKEFSSISERLPGDNRP